MEASDLARKAEEIAYRDVGIKEVPTNSNRGPRIDQYLAYTGVEMGNPYCASACSLWIKEAADELARKPRFKKSARALGLWERNPDLQILPADFTAADLPCIAILDHDGIKGHAFMPIGYDEETGLFTTIDPNSNAHGSREGGGVWLLNIRSIHDAQLKGMLRIL